MIFYVNQRVKNVTIKGILWKPKGVMVSVVAQSNQAPIAFVKWTKTHEAKHCPDETPLRFASFGRICSIAV